MICQQAGSGCLLIQQVDHAALSGELAAMIGNDDFAPLSPSASALLAIARHDAGWPLHDLQPTLNPDGEPLHVFETRTDLCVRIWSASTDQVQQLDPYAGLLVSLHGLALSQIAQRHSANPDAPPHNPAERFALIKFQHRQVEIQEALRRMLGLRTDIPLQQGLASPGISAGEDRLRSNYRWLAAMDRLSLQLCFGKPLFSEFKDIQPQTGQSSIELAVKYMSSSAMCVSPWPFASSRLMFQVPARRMNRIRYHDLQDFQSAYAEASVEMLDVSVSRFTNVD